MQKGLLIKLPKNSHQSRCKNWRIIMLLNAEHDKCSAGDFKGITTVLIKALRGFSSWSELYGLQSDAENYCGTEYRVAVLRVHQLYRVFVKVFDSVSRGVLQQLLRHYGKPVLIATIIIGLNSTLGFSEQVVHNGQTGMKTSPDHQRNPE